MDGVMDRYYFWQAPTNGLPEHTSGGNRVTVIPGLRQWVLLDVDGIPPEGAIPVSRVRMLLDRESKRWRKIDAVATAELDAILARANDER